MIACGSLREIRRGNRSEKFVKRLSACQNVALCRIRRRWPVYKEEIHNRILQKDADV